MLELWDFSDNATVFKSSIFVISIDAEDGEARKSKDDCEGRGGAEGEHRGGGGRGGGLPVGTKIQSESARPAQQTEGRGQRFVQDSMV